VKPPIPVNIITGMLGAGKTTTIRYLLSQCPPGERWAVLVNEFGDVGIDAALIEGQDIAVREVPGGCICCTAALTLRTTLTEMLRNVPMDRLLIEPTGIGHPAGVMDTLRNEWLRDSVTLENVVTVVDPTGFGSERLEKSPIYRDQLQLADVVLINKSDTANEQTLDEIENWLSQLYPPKQKVLRTERGRMPLSDLSGVSRSSSGFDHNHVHLQDEVVHQERPGPVGSSCSSRVEAGIQTLGWVFPPEVVFHRSRIEDRVKDWMQQLPLLRIKAVLNCGRSSLAVNATPETVDFGPVAWRRDSRMEWLIPADSPVDEARIEADLKELIVSTSG
jgi:G3E family GTPase